MEEVEGKGLIGLKKMNERRRLSRWRKMRELAVFDF